MSLFSLKGQSALVTGASSGLGRHFAWTLARAGAKVAIAARRIDRIESLAKELRDAGCEAAPIALDVTDPESVTKAIASAVSQLGGLDVLVNNAGVAQTAPFLKTSEEHWETVLGTNLTGAWRVARAFCQEQVAQGRGGSIINIGSVAGERVAGQLSAYCASKAGLLHLTRAMAAELARRNIRVNALAPGYILTDMNRDFFASDPGQAMIRRVPQRRIGQPSDLDGALLLLASDASAYMTGSVIVVDGGHSQTSI